MPKLIHTSLAALVVAGALGASAGPAAAGISTSPGASNTVRTQDAINHAYAQNLKG